MPDAATMVSHEVRVSARRDDLIAVGRSTDRRPADKPDPRSGPTTRSVAYRRRRPTPLGRPPAKPAFCNIAVLLHYWPLAFLLVPWLAWVLTLPARPAALPVAFSAMPLLVMASWLAARRAGRPWVDEARQHWDVHVLGFVLIVALAVQWADAHGITTDGVIYFSQLRSALFDRDLDLVREFSVLQQPERPSTVVPVGPTFVWLPLYSVVALVDAVGRGLGMWLAPTDPSTLGLTLPYVRAALISSFAVGAVGLLLMHTRLRREFGRDVALAATLLLFLATPLVWYMVYEPSMTHAASFGLVALFVLTAERVVSPTMTRRSAAGLGALLGLAFLTRPQEALFAVFPAMLMATWRVPVSERVRATLRLALWALVGALPFLLVQAGHTWLLTSTQAFALSGEGGYLNPFASRWADTLWSSWHGFFSWTPIAYLAAIASVWYAARHRAWGVSALVILALMAWVNGATADWSGGWSFGGRRFTSVLVMLAPGLALLVSGLVRRPGLAIAMLAAAAVVWNQLLFTQYERRLLPVGELVSYGQLVRQQAALLTGPRFVYPFAFPANAWFAWRTGLPLDRYDLLGPESFASSFTLDMAGDSGKYLLEGWAARATDQFGTLRWSEGARAELVIPFAPRSGESITLTVRARTRLLDPPEAVTLRVLINGADAGQVTPESARMSEHALSISPATLIPGFNRIVFERVQGGAPVGIYSVALRATVQSVPVQSSK